VSFIFLVLSSVMTLTGCTGRNEVVLRMEETESEEAQDAVPEDQGTEERHSVRRMRRKPEGQWKGLFLMIFMYIFAAR